MKKYLLICMMSLMVLCLSGCSEDISDFNIFEYGYNFVEDKIDENRRKSEEAVDQMKENAKGAVDEAIDDAVEKTLDEIEDNPLSTFNPISDFIESLFSGCDHDVPAVFNEEENTISCECGKNVINSELVEFVTATYETLNDETRASEFSELTSSMSNLCNSLSEEISKSTIKKNNVGKKLSKEEKELITNSVEFLDTTSKVLDVAVIGINIYDYSSQVAENGQSLETVNMQVSIFQDLAGYIPIFGDYYSQLLGTVSEGLKVLDKGYDILQISDFTNDIYMYGGANPSIYEIELKNFYNLGAKHQWNNGPTLKDLSDAKTAGILSDEDIAILSPYITYRFEQEFANCTNLDLIDTNNESTDTTDTE